MSMGWPPGRRGGGALTTRSGRTWPAEATSTASPRSRGEPPGGRAGPGRQRGGTLDTQGELRRQLGLGSAVALVVGEVIGVGIFLTPAGMARSLGSPFWLLVVWLVMGAV